MTRKTIKSGCGQVDDGGSMSVAAIVRHYGLKYGQKAQDELGRFRQHRNMPSLRDAIGTAAQSRDSEGLRHKHQRRLKERDIANATKLLVDSAERIQECSNFHALLRHVDDILAETPGVGELYKYDVSLRIGAWLGHMPERVYLHAGTRIGAAALGLDTSDGMLEMSALPPELQRLPACEVEDILCIYKGRFRKR